jgi:zinc protease
MRARALTRFVAAVAVVACSVAAFPACGPGESVQPPVIGGVPKPTTSTSVVAPTSASPNPDAYLADLPKPAEPKPVTPAKVFSIDTKVPVKAIGLASKNLPIVTISVVVRAGNAAAITMGIGAKSKAGIADITAELMKQGGAGRFTPTGLADHVDGLGADLSVDTSFDRVTFSIAVTKDKLDAALEVLAAVVLHPKFDAKEFDKLKGRELDRVRQAQKSSGGWLARNALYRELFGPGHPYSEADATEQTLDNIKLADVKDFYKKLYVTGNTLVVVAGDIDQAEMAAKLDKHLEGFSKAAPPVITFPAPAALTGKRVILALKPGSKQADIFVGMLGLPRKDEHWPELAIAVHSLGGGMSARLFRDVREKRSLAYSTNANARELANGPSLLALYAGTQTAQAPQSVVALLENLSWISGSQPVSPEELDIAKISLETNFVYRLETIGSVAALAIDKEILQLPGADVYDYVATYRKTLHDATLDKVKKIATEQLASPGMVIAVAGDPALAKPLSHFASVRVVDPEKGFATVSQLPEDPKAPLDVALPAPSTK